MPKWTSAYSVLAKIPPPFLESPAIMGAVASLATAALKVHDSLGHPTYLEAVRWAVSQALPGRNLAEFTKAHLRFLVHFHIRTFELARGPQVNLLGPDAKVDLAELEKVREHSTGVLLPSSHVAVPLEMLFASFPGEKALVLSQEIPMVREICARADSSWEFIALEKGGVRGKVEAALKKGKAVVVNTDFCGPHSKVEFVRVFGLPVPVAKGAFSIAQALECPVVPLLIGGTRSGIHLTALPARRFKSGQTSDIKSMMQDVLSALELHVKSQAEEWIGWAYLPQRWKQGIDCGKAKS